VAPQADKLQKILREPLPRKKKDGVLAKNISLATRISDARKTHELLPTVVDGKHWFCVCIQSDGEPSDCVLNGCITFDQIQAMLEGKGK
jgi:hypothetical protein